MNAAAERALAGAGRTDQTDDLSLVNFEVDIMQGLELAEGLVQVFYFNHFAPSSVLLSWKDTR